jgi:hypothetical protein
MTCHQRTDKPATVPDSREEVSASTSSMPTVQQKSVKSRNIPRTTAKQDSVRDTLRKSPRIASKQQPVSDSDHPVEKKNVPSKNERHISSEEARPANAFKSAASTRQTRSTKNAASNSRSG